MIIYFGTDHAGFTLKEALVAHLKVQGQHEVVDMGAHTENPADDYPDFVRSVAERVATEGDDARGIILGGSGQGEAICANRTRGIRAVVYYGGPREIVTLSRTHNNANVLSLGARFLSVDEAVEVVDIWLQEDFSHEERHARRNTLLDA